MSEYHHPSHRLTTADEHRAYYDQRAQTYDEQFAAALSYALPHRVAAIVRSVAAVPGPVADLGCGTGLLGTALLGSRLVVDGLDVSAGMLSRAAATGAYHNLVEADLSRPLPPRTAARLPAQGYPVVASVGTFTVGHLGPDALRLAIGLGGPGCQYVIAVNERHFVDRGFAATLRALAADGTISPPRRQVVGMYDDPDAPDDPVCRAVIVTCERSRARDAGGPPSPPAR